MVFLVGRESPFFDREKARRGFEENKENLDDVNDWSTTAVFLTFTIRTAMSDRFLFIKARPITFFIWADTEYAKNIANAWTRYGRRRICSRLFMPTQGT